MKQLASVELDIRVTPWVTKPWGKYRIWVATDGWRWWQAHEWERQDGNREREAEPWISGGRGWGTAIEPAPGDAAPCWRMHR